LEIQTWLTVPVQEALLKLKAQGHGQYRLQPERSFCSDCAAMPNFLVSAFDVNY
jgi:hypothetical protein